MNQFTSLKLTSFRQDLTVRTKCEIIRSLSRSWVKRICWSGQSGASPRAIFFKCVFLCFSVFHWDITVFFGVFSLCFDCACPE